MRIDSEQVDGVLILRVSAPRVDAAEAVQFKDSVRDAAADGPERVILDMGEVEFLDSSGLGAVIGSMKLLAPNQKLELANLTPAVSKVFHLTRMNTVLPIHEHLPFAGAVVPPERGRAHAI